MTLEEAMRFKGLIPPNGGIGRKCHCPNPDHGRDRSPSAVLNLNNVYCFVCEGGRVFGLRYLEELWGVTLEYVNGGEFSASLAKMRGAVIYNYNHVLFRNNFEVCAV